MIGGGWLWNDVDGGFLGGWWWLWWIRGGVGWWCYGKREREWLRRERDAEILFWFNRVSLMGWVWFNQVFGL